MREILRRLIKLTVGYGAIQWAGPFLSLIFTPIITRFLSPSDYGIADFALTVASAVGTLTLFALPQAITAHFNDRPSDEEWQGRLTGSALVLSLTIGVPIGLILILFAPYIAQSTFESQRYTHLFQLIGATVAFGVCSGILPAAAQAALRVRWGMLFSAVTILGTVLGNVLFIVVLRLGATGMVLTPTATGIAVSLVALVVMRNRIRKPSPAIIRLVLNSSAVLFPTMVAAWTLQLVDRFFLIKFVSVEVLGHYAIANRVATLLYVMMVPLYSAWTPLALSIQHETDARQRYATLSRYLVGVVLLGALALGLFAKEILVIFTRPAYLPASPYIGFLAYVHVLSTIGTILQIGAFVGKQLQAISITTIVGAMVHIALNFILIPSFGAWGATAATVVGYAVPNVFLYLLLQKRFPVPYPAARLVGALCVQFCLLGAGLLLPPLSFPLRIITKLLVFTALPLSFLLLGVITPYEIAQLRAIACDIPKLKLRDH